MKLFKYGEFITESHLQLLLEANINFTKEFVSILGRVDSSISKKLIDIEGREIDINQNYIGINKEKTDTIFFKPDDKVGKVAKVVSQNGIYRQITYQLSKIEGSGVENDPSPWYEESDFVNPENDTVGQVVKEYSLEEISNFLPDYKSNLEYLFITGNPLVLFQWFKDRKKYQILINKDSISTGP